MRYAVLGAALLVSASAWAEPAPTASKAPSFGRIVIPLNGATKPIVRQRRTSVDVTIKGGEDIATPDMVPRNVTSFIGGHGTAAFKIVPGSLISSRREGDTLIIDVPDPATRPKGAEATSDARPNPSKLTAVMPPKAAKALTSPQPPTSVPLAEPVPQSTVTAQPATVPEGAAPVPAAPERPAPPLPQPVESAHADAPAAPPPAAARRVAPREFTVVTGPDVGVAAFRQGAMGVVVFDDPVALDDSDDRTITPTLQQIQRGTLMTLPLSDDETLAVRRTETNVTVTIAASTGTPAVATAIPSGIQYKFSRPGRVMAVSDPISGQTMLVGTTRQVNGEQARIETPRSAPGCVMLPTWLGIVVEISSENIDLKASLAGYTLLIADKASTNTTAAAQQENRFSLPVAPTPILVRQLSAQMASAAAAPPRGRGPERVAAARTMLALGMSAESEALLNLAATDDPAIARDPSTAALTGVAAVLAGRPAEATGLDNPALPTGGDIALWRGLRDVAEGKPAPALAGAWPLLSAYPESIKRQIAPPVLEAAAENGADVPAQEMEGPDFALARALKLAHDGQVSPALAAFDAVKDSRDERASVRATIAAAELRLRTGAITPADTAEILERQTLRWRGGVQELALRRRVAELRTQAGQWRAALDGLAQTETIFPASKNQLKEMKAGVFRALLSRPGSSIAPLEVVSVAGDFADVVPDGPDGDRLAGLLAEKLMALDLPQRAIPVLRTLMDKSQSASARAEYGLRLAQMKIDAGDPASAEALLSDINLSDSAPDREERRTMLLAQAKASRGDFAGAATVLLTLNSTEANDMRANYYARAGDWQRSLETLDAMAAGTLPVTGVLDDKQQELLLREVTAAVQAGNATALKRLAKYDGRLTSPRADLFRVLTLTDVKGPEDLPRAARELTMSRSFPDRLNALKK